MINLVLALSIAALAFSVWIYISTKRESRKTMSVMQSLVERAFWRNMSSPLKAADLFPEFQQLPELTDGERYVLAKQPVQDDGGALHVTNVSATYLSDKDSWRFSDGLVTQRREDDLWIKDSDYPAALERSHERMLQRVAAESKT